MIAVDSSVVIAACVSWHELHEAAGEVVQARPRLVGHCALEAYSVLTRLPAAMRVAPALAVGYLDAMFPDEPLLLGPADVHGLAGRLHERGIAGGAVYDGLIALTAAAHGAELLSLDRRAAETYRRCGVSCRLLAGPGQPSAG